MRRNPDGGRAVTLRLKPVRKANGKTYWYARRPDGKLGKLPDLPHDDPTFLAAYAEHMAAQPTKITGKHGPGTIGAAIDAYQSSDAWRILKPGTQAARRRHLARAASTWGAARLRDLATRHIEADMDTLSGHAAHHRLKAWRGFCKWAKGKRLIASDPSLAAQRPTLPKSKGHTPWTLEDVATFRAHWPIGSAQRLGMELIFWTGARVSDAVRLGPGMIDRAGWLAYAQQKTGGDVAVPFRRSLPGFASGWQADLDLLRQAIKASPHRHMTWLVTAAGAGRSEKAAAAWFSAACRAAKVEKTAHGLRKLRGQMLAEAGATTHQAAAWLGHESLSEVARYSRGADKRRVLAGDETGTNLETVSGQPGNSNAK